MSENNYQPPKVWEWKQNNGGAFANINRPVSGATHDRVLPVGAHPLQLYSLGTPNGQKVTIMLEELLALGVSGAEYDAWLIRIGEGDQFSSGFVEVNPNSKIPALRDHSTTPPTRVFESGSILLYLAEKFGFFLPKDPAGRTETLNWLFWLQGLGPVPRRRFWPFLQLCAGENRIRDRTALRWKPNASLTYSTSSLPAAVLWQERSTPSPTWLSGRGTATWCWGTFTTPPSSLMPVAIKTCCAGRRTSATARPFSADVWLTAPQARSTEQLHERHDASDFDTQTEDKRQA
ncbi:putative glutathione S-transferase YghU [Klebsiella grimontii]|uniref:Putative glutathione S-transferase YghU n=1 Tax=Klebsiella grimontii TaxID=2058152 RepID=A0A7H4NWL5_9ENTR|nr:putative glutathione S-transferase YghU [Klebsiella grimontii]